ncbi:enzymatic polyprotein endonuclease reverse, partial [Vairimorpha apis BRL 01]
NYRLGAVLRQKNEKGNEVRYGISEKEMLAVYWGIKKFEYELRGRKFKIRTDHKALVEIRNKPYFNNNRINRWIEKIQEFDFTIEYRKPELMIVADTLSRINMEEDGKQAKIKERTRKRKEGNNIGNLIVVGKTANEIVTREIKEKYYWPGIKKVITVIIKKCEKCQIYSRKSIGGCEFVDTTRYLEKVAIDFRDLGKYVLKGKREKEIITDNGKEFINEDFRRLCRSLEIKHRQVSVEAHRSNGRIERVIGTLRESILKSEKETFKEKVMSSIERYNRSYHTGIKRTPIEALEDKTGHVMIENSPQDNYGKKTNSKTSTRKKCGNDSYLVKLGNGILTNQKKLKQKIMLMAEDVNVSTTSTSVSLTTHLESVNFSEKEWPQQALLSASDVFNAMFSTNSLQPVMENSQRICVEDMENARKIPSLKIDILRLEAVIKSVGFYIDKHPSCNMTDIDVTRKEVKPSVWKESILKKIESINAKLSVKEKLNLKLCLHHDISKAIASIDNTIKASKEIKSFWSTIYLQIIFPAYAEFQDIIKYLPNWKASGCNGIKHLIPKGTSTRGSDYRPITCIYAIDCREAKEQALLNIAINKENRNLFKTMWIYIVEFLRATVKQWHIEIRLKRKYYKVFKKDVQIDSQSFVNREKSANICIGFEEDAVIIESSQGYKYLSIIEDSSSVIKILKLVERLCMTKLNGINMIRAINKHAISVINYHVGLLKLELEEHKKHNFEIRQVLIKHHIHLQPACKEIYLPRSKIRRGLACVENRSENMLLNKYNSLSEFRNSSLRRAVILKEEENNKSHLSQIIGYLWNKYELSGIVTTRMLIIKKRTNHGNEHKDSSTLLVKENNQTRSEATYCFFRSHRKTMDYLATKCDRTLSFDYTRRHNKVVKCTHLLLCKKYGLKKTNKIRSHSVQLVISTDIKIRKQEKFNCQIGLIYKSKTKIISYVMTWDVVNTNILRSIYLVIIDEENNDAGEEEVERQMEKENNDPEDLTGGNKGEIKKYHKISSVPEHEANIGNNGIIMVSIISKCWIHLILILKNVLELYEDRYILFKQIAKAALFSASRKTMSIKSFIRLSLPHYKSRSKKLRCKQSGLRFFNNLSHEEHDGYCNNFAFCTAIIQKLYSEKIALLSNKKMITLLLYGLIINVPKYLLKVISKSFYRSTVYEDTGSVDKVKAINDDSLEVSGLHGEEVDESLLNEYICTLPNSSLEYDKVFKLITCMSKLTIKCVTAVMHLMVERVLRAKEQMLINIMLIKPISLIWKLYELMLRRHIKSNNGTALSLLFVTFMECYSKSSTTFTRRLKLNLMMAIKPVINFYSLTIKAIFQEFKSCGLEMNTEKSATNSVISSHEGYKYLGIIESKIGKNIDDTDTVEKILYVKLVNEFAISQINYFFKKIDNASKERLYLSRNESGRGLNIVDINDEQILFRRKAILFTEKAKNHTCTLKHGSIQPREEDALCAFQDRNSFLEKGLKYYMDTQCDRKFKSKKIRNHSLQKFISNKLIMEKFKKEILIVEVGITSFNNLRAVEKKIIIGMICLLITTNNICYKMGDDINFYKQYKDELNIDSRTTSYVLSRVVKMTLKSISMKARRGEHINENERVIKKKELEKLNL